MYPWKHNRRFNDYSNYIKDIFGSRIQKLTINAGFTCPNRDGKISFGGCTFCNNEAFNPSYCSPEKSITQQLEEGISFHRDRYRRANGYLAYFQAFSNTYAPLSKLKELYLEALSFPNIKGLIIGTRPDCIDEEILQFMAELTDKYYVTIEYGIESCYNKTLEKINRGHSFEQAKDALITTHNKGIHTGAHIIFGLPDETEDEMYNMATILSKLPITTIKFHQLQIFNNTPIANEYESNPHKFKLFELNEYIDFVINFTEILNPNIVIERFAGEGTIQKVAYHNWNIRYDQVLQLIEKRMEERNTWQGKYYNPTI